VPNETTARQQRSVAQIVSLMHMLGNIEKDANDFSRYCHKATWQLMSRFYVSVPLKVEVKVKVKVIGHHVI